MFASEHMIRSVHSSSFAKLAFEASGFFVKVRKLDAGTQNWGKEYPGFKCAVQDVPALAWRQAARQNHLERSSATKSFPSFSSDVLNLRFTTLAAVE